MSEGLTPREATRKSMGQIEGAGRYRDGAVCGIRAVVLFNDARAIYRQFSITIVSAMVAVGN